MGWSVSAEEDEDEAYEDEDEEQEGASTPAGTVTDPDVTGLARPADLAAGLGASAGEMVGVLEAVAAEADGDSAFSDPRVRHKQAETQLVRADSCGIQKRIQQQYFSRQSLHVDCGCSEQNWCTVPSGLGSKWGFILDIQGWGPPSGWFLCREVIALCSAA